MEIFGEFTEHLSQIVSDHIPKPYKTHKKFINTLKYSICKGKYDCILTKHTNIDNIILS